MINNIILLIIGCAIFVISNIICLFRNPIYSVLLLLCLVLLVSILLVIFNVYYLALTLIIIYGGAVVILFLFLIFTLHKDFKISFDYKIYLPNNIVLSIFFLTNLVFSLLVDNFYLDSQNFPSSYKSSTRLFIFIFKYKYNDINIFTENLFSVYFIFLGVTVCVMLLALIMAIIIAKRSDKSKTGIIKDDTTNISFIKARILNGFKK